MEELFSAPGGCCHGNADKPGGLSSSESGSCPAREAVQDDIDFLQQELSSVPKASAYRRIAGRDVLTQFREENDAAAG